jgi:hypothetical protein
MYRSFYEANIQALSNIIIEVSRLVITNQLLKIVFKRAKGDSSNLWIISGVLAITFYVTSQSRALQVHTRFFKPNYNEIPESILNNIKVTKLGTLVDLISSLTRSVPLG